VEGTVDAVLEQVATGREDLGRERLRVIVLALDLAEVGRLPVAQQCLEDFLLLAALDLDLEVTAAGGTPGAVGGAAGGLGTGVHAVVHGQRAAGGGWHRERPRTQPPALDDPEPVPPELSWLGRRTGRRHGPDEIVRPAADGVAVLAPEMPAGDVDPRWDMPFILDTEQRPELEALCVAEHPRGIVVGTVADGGDPQGHVEGVAMSAEGSAGGRRHGVQLFREAIRAERGR
jgi:hypothetical protein